MRSKTLPPLFEATHTTRGLALIVLGMMVCGCETPAPKKARPQTSVKESIKPAAPASVELDALALCKVRAEIEDARQQNTLEALRETIIARRKKTPEDPIAIYGALHVMDDEQERWKAFKALDGPLTPLRDLGECEIYSHWKMADQAAGPCGRVAGDSALVDLAYANYDRQREDPAAAMVHLDELLTKTPDCSVALMHKAQLLQVTGSVDRLDGAWAASLQAWPGCSSCAVSRAEAAEKVHGIEKALPLWEAALELAPGNVMVLQRYATAQVGHDDAKALQAYETALEQNSEDFPTLLAAARLSRSLNDLVKAVQYAEKASGLEPDNQEVWRELVALYSARDETTGLEKALIEVLRLDPADGNAHLELARLARKDGDFLGALDGYEQAMVHLKTATKAPVDAAGSAPAANAVAASSSRQLAEAELTALKDELLITKRAPRGNADQVVTQVQRTARKLFEAQRKNSPALAGILTLRVTTDKEGAVVNVEITDDTLKDPRVAASLVGNLRAARFEGGAQRVRFDLEFE